MHFTRALFIFTLLAVTASAAPALLEERCNHIACKLSVSLQNSSDNLENTLTCRVLLKCMAVGDSGARCDGR